MCGIAGYMGQFEKGLLPKMADVMSHRGPDGEGLSRIEEHGVGLAHRRLAVLDVSAAGHQPMTDAAGKVTIVYNGEIYNFVQLRDELKSKGFSFKGHSDTEVLMNLYLALGEKMLPKLNGVFAFAIWDHAKNELFIARDHLGIKPLYLAEDARGVLFASEIKSILQDKQLSRELDHRAVRDYLTYLYCPAPRTMLKSVKKILPGESLVVQGGKVVKRTRWYTLPYDQEIEEVSFQDAAIGVRSNIQKAVKQQMVSDVPLGAFLSGGLDSSAVVAFAQQSMPDNERLQCFSMNDISSGSESGNTEDLPYAKQVAKHLGVDLHVVDIDSSVIERLEKVIWHLDEPQADPAAINTWMISELAHEHGIKVLLSGAGGDDVFTGYRRHYALSQEKFWSWLPRLPRKSIRRFAEALPTKNAYARRISKAFSYADHSDDSRLLSYFRWLDQRTVNSLLARDIQDELSADAFCESLATTLNNVPPNTHPLNKMLFMEKSHFLPDHNLNYTDKMTMATGVECRVPLLDPDVIAMAARLPIEFKQQGRVGKAVFKKAMEGILPNDVIYRPKTGFGAPLRRWLQVDLRELIDDILSRQSISARGLFDPDAVRNIVELDRAGKIDAGYGIYALVCIEVWCRLFID